MEEAASKDRLSTLPEPILHTILSRLPTKTSVSTSALSKNFRFLWAFVPTLNLDVSEYSKKESFSNIVNKVLSLYKSETLNSFRLYCYNRDCSEADIDMWVAKVIECNVKYLDISILSEITENIPRLPVRLFTCNTLVDLSLSFCGLPTFRGDITFPSLKRLRLSYLQHLVDESLPKLLSGCPVLEDLSIRGLSFGSRYLITSTTITRLTIDFPNTDENVAHNYKVYINTPVLQFLVLRDAMLTQIEAHVFASLIEAEIVIESVNPSLDEGYYLSFLKFLHSLCKVQDLKLKVELLMPPRFELTAQFYNCIKLEVDVDFDLLNKMIDNAKYLEVLVINMPWFVNSKEWVEPTSVATCLSRSLRRVDFNLFTCMEPEYETVGYLLMNGAVLEKMTIKMHSLFDPGSKFGRMAMRTHNASSSKSKIGAKKKIESFPKKCEACQLLFY